MADYQNYTDPTSVPAAQMVLANALASNGTSTSPVISPWQGAAKLADALAAKSMYGRIGANQAGAVNRYAGMFGPQGGQAAVPAGGSPPPGLQPPPGAPPPGAPPPGGVPPASGAISTGGPNAPQATAGAPGGAPPAQNPFPVSAPPSPGSSQGGTGNNYPNTPEGHSAFIRDRAAALGLDPRLPLGIASAEGNNASGWKTPNLASAVDVQNGQPFSFGDFQLNVRNGLGSEARAHGIDPSNPNQWQQSDEFALETMAKGGLQPWQGDAAVKQFQGQGGGWQAPRSGGGSPEGGAMAFSPNGPQPPAAAAITGAAGAGNGMSGPPSAPNAQQMDPRVIAQRMQQLVQIIGDPYTPPAIKESASQMLQQHMQLLAPHPSTWSSIPGTNDQRQMDWLGNPTGRAIQGGPMKMNSDEQLYTVPPNGGPPSMIGAGMSPPPNAGAGMSPPPNAGAPQAPQGGPQPMPQPGPQGGPPPPQAMPQPGPQGMPQPGPAPGTPAGGGNPQGGPQGAPQPGGPMQPGGPQGAPGGPQGAPGQPQQIQGAFDPMQGMRVQGEDYLDRVQNDPTWGRYVPYARGILRGQIPMPTGNAATKGVDQRPIQLALAADPNFNANVAGARADAFKQFSDKTSPGAPGGMILAANKALHHLGALADTASQMGNGSYPALNWMRNYGEDYTVGNPNLKAYQFNKEALAQEVAKIYKGGTPAEAEIHAMVESLSPNMTPAEQQAVFGKISTLLQGATGELQRQWHTLYGANSPDYPVLGSESQGLIQRFNGGQPQGAPQQSQGAPVRLNPQSADADYAKLRRGAQFVGPDGKTRTKQ